MLISATLLRLLCLQLCTQSRGCCWVCKHACPLAGSAGCAGWSRPQRPTGLAPASDGQAWHRPVLQVREGGHGHDDGRGSRSGAAARCCGTHCDVGWGNSALGCLWPLRPHHEAAGLDSRGRCRSEGGLAPDLSRHAAGLGQPGQCSEMEPAPCTPPPRDRGRVRGCTRPDLGRQAGRQAVEHAPAASSCVAGLDAAWGLGVWAVPPHQFPAQMELPRLPGVLERRPHV